MGRGNLRDRARAAAAMRAACAQLGLYGVEVHRVRNHGAGLSSRALASLVTARGGWERALCALLPQSQGIVRDVERERRLLAFLAELELPFRVPRIAEVVEQDGERVLVREFLDGYPARETRWDLTTELAAATHRIPLDALGWLPGHATCREHGEHRIAELASLDDPPPEVRDALAWMHAHLPPNEPTVLLQGDLLPQNILLSLDDEPPGIADWERAQRGDPAYDLAVVTRAKRGGLEEALAAYARGSGRELAEERVRFHEVGLLVGFHRNALEQGQEGVVENERRRLGAFLRRLGR